MEGQNTEIVQQRNEVVGKVDKIQVIKPKPPAIPTSEGTHLQVTTDQAGSWRQRDIREILRMAFFALPTAKIVAEGYHTPDFWTNIHLNAKFDQGVNVFGRKPDSATGWAKPVTIRDVDDEVALEGKAPKAVIDRYLDQWEKLLPQVTLFPQGVKEVSSNNEGSQDEKTVWENEKFNLVIIKKPHLSGLHMVVHPKESYWKEKGGFKRAWQVDYQSGSTKPTESQEHIQGFLEAAAIIVGAEKILLEGEDALDFHNPEIHFSGNWAKDLQPKEAGGKLDPANLTKPSERKDEKVKHRVGGKDEWATAMHGHLYATRNPDEYVSLPSRPQAEVPAEWEGITPLTTDEEDKIENLISQRLSPWLEQNAKGEIGGS